jgi:hypothetical protein
MPAPPLTAPVSDAVIAARGHHRRHHAVIAARGPPSTPSMEIRDIFHFRTSPIPHSLTSPEQRARKSRRGACHSKQNHKTKDKGDECDG